MLTTVRSFSARDAVTRLRGPAWRAPIVGTRPTDSPARRQPATRSRIDAAVATTSGRELATAVADPFVHDREAAGVAVLGIGEGAGLPLRGVAAGRLDDLRPELGELLDEAWLAARAQPEHVLDDEHLAVALDAGANPDGGDPEAPRHAGGQGRRNAFEDDREGARGFELAGDGEDPGGNRRVLALDLEAAHPVDALGGEA